MSKPSKFWPRFIVALLVCHASAMILAVNVALSGHDSRDLRDAPRGEGSAESQVLDAFREVQGEGAPGQ